MRRHSRRKLGKLSILAVIGLTIALSSLIADIFQPKGPFGCDQTVWEKIVEPYSADSRRCQREEGLFYFDRNSLGIYP